MAVRTKDDFIKDLQTILGDNTSDEALTLIEDATDTFEDLENNHGEDWKTKYEQNDAMWRKKYKDRFFNPQQKEDEEEVEPSKKPKRFEDLFKVM